MEAWNFCPWCGHRTYQHSNNPGGCGHIEHRTTVCTDPDCTPGIVLSPDAAHTHEMPVPCGCKHPYQQMAIGAG